MQAGFNRLKSSRRGLLTQTELLHDGTVALDVTVVKIVEQGTTLTYKLGQRTSGDEILVISFHMLCEVLDAISEQCDLALCRTRIYLALTVLLKNLFLLCFV